jgi:cell division septal protein FtsQ
LYIPSGVTRQKKNKKKKIPEARGAPLFCSVHLSVCGLLLLLVVASSYIQRAMTVIFVHIQGPNQTTRKKKGWATNGAAGVLKFFKL